MNVKQIVIFVFSNEEAVVIRKYPFDYCLFLFYQKSNELLFRHTVDSYKLPIHNVFSIIKEISGVSTLLRISNTVDRYFESYISPMIDEFLFLANNDKIFKKMMGEYFGEVINKFDKHLYHFYLLK